jgi:hypothetical protein
MILVLWTVFRCDRNTADGRGPDEATVGSGRIVNATSTVAWPWLDKMQRTASCLPQATVVHSCLGLRRPRNQVSRNPRCQTCRITVVEMDLLHCLPSTGPRADKVMTTSSDPRQKIEALENATRATLFGTERTQGKRRGEKDSIRFESG